MSKVIELTNQDFTTEVLQSKIFVLVDFWAPWCGPCLIMSPILDELAEEFDDKIKIVKINVETSDNQQLAVQYEVQSIPNMKLFKNGKIIKEFIGIKQKEALKQELEAEL